MEGFRRRRLPELERLATPGKKELANDDAVAL